MTNDQIRERIALLKELIELETKLGLVKSGSGMVDSAPWYPDDRGWIECNPSMKIDRSMIVEVLYDRERKSKIYAAGSPDLNFNDTAWDDEFSGNADERNIVAVLMKNNL